ncbi:uncharacterized protein PHALS_01403 [Plasmopara halstedii]|uniref:Uncharacterized protein n=1 Tax=Plasmopara halstedii TaxID=4781 RepID=A0A0P1AT99_PLAHL|nr:uncharacterized protein PHALS_01403 [Plasmopara halstedii]CEG45077.1 hypothetical protein PHALS_01403 [Plasmopara halstedii]|eukprot:XP_024581446.1 hypothetical protein PHALS_01403 [Plasmopara halstedii]
MTTTYGDRIRVAKTGPVQPPKGTLQRIDSNYHILKLRSFFSLCLLGIRVARLDTIIDEISLSEEGKLADSSCTE